MTLFLEIASACGELLAFGEIISVPRVFVAARNGISSFNGSSITRHTIGLLIHRFQFHEAAVRPLEVSRSFGKRAEAFILLEGCNYQTNLTPPM